MAWEEYLTDRHYLASSRVTYRHLEVEFTDSMLQNLQRFVKVVKGKRYHLSALKLLVKSNDESDGYFCSQLVAAGYKSLGLIPNGTPSSSFWPGDFSSKKDLQLSHGAYLSEEQVIDFDSLR